MKLIAIIPVAVFALLGGLFFAGMKADDSAGLPTALAGKPAPAMTVTPLGDLPTLSDETLRAPGVKVVNFWASWCAPCRAEHPNLMTLAQSGIPIYGINYKNDPNDAQGFLGELGNPFTAIGADFSGRTGLDWGLYGVPETFVIDGDGEIRFRFAGPITAEVLEKTLMPEIKAAEAN